MLLRSAKSILEDVIYRIKVQYPEFIYALNMLELQEVEMGIPISTNGEKLFYNEIWVINSYKSFGLKRIKRHIMHVLFHLLLGDLEEMKRYRSTAVAETIMDYRVDKLVFQLFKEDYDGGEKMQMDSLLLMEQQNSKISNYFYLRKHRSVQRQMKEYEESLEQDDHSFWNKKNEMTGTQENEDNLLEINVQMVDLTKEEEKKRTEKWQQASQITFQAKFPIDFSEIEKIAEKMSIKSQMKKYGRGAGNVQVLVNAKVDKEKNYEELIRECLNLNMSSGENPDSIDRMMYQYGFDLYENVALIEPMEEDEMPQVRTIGIAIDTSGSCNGDVAQKFLGVLGAVFQDAARYLTNSEVYLFECDDAIQKEECLDGREIDEQTFQSRNMYGWGGTSFTPVFERMNELQQEKQIKFDALLYLSDGIGEYPEQKPEYPTYFLMPDGVDGFGYEWCEIPKWIHKIAI